MLLVELRNARHRWCVAGDVESVSKLSVSLLRASIICECLCCEEQWHPIQNSKGNRARRQLSWVGRRRPFPSQLKVVHLESECIRRFSRS